MLYKFLLAFCYFCFSGAIAANSLIPIEHFSKHRTYHQIKLSPTGQYIAAEITNEYGKKVVAVLERDSMKITGVFNFKGSKQPGSFYWLNDERVAVNVVKKFGTFDRPMHTGNVFAMNVDGRKKKLIFGYDSKGGVLVNPSIDFMSVLNMLPDDPKHIIIASKSLNSNTGKYVRAYKLNVYSGKKRKLATSPIVDATLLADRAGEIRFAMGADASNNNKIKIYSRAKKGDDWELTDSFFAEDGGFEPVAFAKDSQSVYMELISNDAPTKLYLYNLKTKQRQLVAGHDVVDINKIDIDSTGNVFAVHFEPAYSSVKVIDQQHPLGKWYAGIRSAFPGQRVTITSATRDYQLITIKVQSDKQPGAFYLFNAKTKSLSKLMMAKPWLDQTQLAQTDAFSFKSRDGLTIYGFITVPKGKSTNLPMGGSAPWWTALPS